MAEQLYIQTKFTQFAGAQLSRFKRVNTYLWNFRCPYCGDSEKSTSKARGYVYKNKHSLLSYTCHNCGTGASFKSFLKKISTSLFKEYLLESYKDDDGGVSALDAEPEVIIKEWHKHLTPLTSLSKIHIATQYVKGRLIPEDKYDRFWYTHNFADFVDQIGIEHSVPADPRLLFVETDTYGNLKIIIARAIKESTMRYVTLTTDDNYPKLFGLGKLNFTRQIHVCEGAIDSLFVPNCIATLDSNLLAYKQHGKIDRPVLIWDNEARAPIIVGKMEAALRSGEKVVIFPDHITHKDLNQMVEHGIDVVKLINTNTYTGITGLLRLNQWKRTC